MTGHNAFEQIAALAGKPKQAHEPVSREAFEQWKQDFTFEGLKGLRYGQSFCNHFGISDNLLYYTMWPVEEIHDYILRYYIEGS
jgi:hypothetical protein